MIKQLNIIGLLLLALIFVSLLSITPLLSQPKEGMKGITTTIYEGFVNSQDANISTNTGSLNIGMAYMPSNRINLRGELGFRSQKDTSGAKNSEFTFTVYMWYYLQTSESVSTFLGGGLGFGSANTASGNGTSLLNLNGFFGAEYWFSPHFSWFGHIGLVYSSYSIAEKPAWDVLFQIRHT